MPSSSSFSSSVGKGKGAESSLVVPGSGSGSGSPVDDYWSDEAVERRRRLRERLFADDEEDEEDEEDENDEKDGEDEQQAGSTASDEDDEKERTEGQKGASTAASSSTNNNVLAAPNPPQATLPVPAPESISQLNAAAKGKSKAGPPGKSRKPGFMARSLVIDHSKVEDEEDVKQDTVRSDLARLDAVKDSVGPSKVGPSTANTMTTDSTRIPEITETGKTSSVNGTGVVQPERRKSVTFNPSTRVRLYEKGEVMPLVSKPSVDKIPAQTAADPDARSRFEVVPDDDDEMGGKTVSPGPASAKRQAVKSAVVVKSKNEGAFSGFKKGFLDNKPAGKQPSTSAAPTCQKTTAGEVIERKPGTATVPVPQSTTTTATTTTEHPPEYQQPLAPAHNNSPAARTAKKQKSLFSQRKAESMDQRSQLMNFSSFDPMPVVAPAGAGVASGKPVGTGKEEIVAPPTAVARPIKMAVVERVVSKPRAPPTVAAATAAATPPVSPIPLTPSSQVFPPKVAAGRKARDVLGQSRTGQQAAATAVKDTIVERKSVVPPPRTSQAGR